MFETYAKAAKFISDNGINGSIELLVDGDPTQGYTVRVIGGEFDGDVFYDHSSPLVFSNKASGGANSGKSSKSGIDWAGIGRTAADFTPILGGCLDCYEGYQNGDGMQIAMGVVSLIADGVTLGGSSLLKGTIKTGIKQGSKQLAKKAAKEAAKDGVKYTKSNMKLGREMHRQYKIGADGVKEFRLPSGKRIDFLDIKNNTIYELKPYNPRAMKAGQKQLDTYMKELQTMPQFKGETWKTILETY